MAFLSVFSGGTPFGENDEQSASQLRSKLPIVLSAGGSSASARGTPSRFLVYVVYGLELSLLPICMATERNARSLAIERYHCSEAAFIPAGRPENRRVSTTGLFILLEGQRSPKITS